MESMVQSAQEAIQKPEVLEMLQKLSKYRLGIFMPHMHPPEGGFIPLPDGVVQLEGDLKVEFVNEDDPALQSAVPVGWVWDGKRLVAAANCYCGGASHGPDWGWHKKSEGSRGSRTFMGRIKLGNAGT